MRWVEGIIFSPIVMVSIVWFAWRAIAIAVVAFKQAKDNWQERCREQEARRRYEEELIAWRFAQPPLELTPEEVAAGWQVMRFSNGGQCKMMSTDVSMRKLYGPAPFVPPKEPYVFEDGLAKLRSLLPKPTQSPFDFAEDLAARRKALEGYKF